MNLVWGFLILVAADALAITAMLLVRRRAPEGSYFTDGDRASGVFGVLATGFAIFAGFVIFLAFTSYDQSRSGSEAEAMTVVQQFETAQFLPVAVRTRLTGELVCYGRSVVHQEWPQMENGSSGDTINPWSVALFTTLKQAKPVAASEQAAYGKWLDQTSDRETARRDRLHGASGIIPTSLWLVLFLTAGVVFAYMLFFADSARARALAGDADGLGHDDRRGHAPRDQRAGPSVPGRGWEYPAGCDGAHAPPDRPGAGGPARQHPASMQRRGPPGQVLTLRRR